MPALGHERDRREMKRANEAGLDHATHLFNRMAGIDKKHPESARAGVRFILNHSSIRAELIAAGIHVPVPPDARKLCGVKG